MGSKFCSLNIFAGDLPAVETRCPGFAIRAVSPGWITVADDAADWCEMRKLAKRLSKDWAVLETEYFDDDFVSFSVYRDGKRMARHVPAEYEGFPRSPGKPHAWAELFGLPLDAEKTLKAVFQETNPEVSLRLLACVLGCPLWVDGKLLADVRPPTQDYLRDHLARKAAEKTIKNATRLALLDEQEGDFRYASTYPLLRQEESDPKYWQDGGNRKSIWAIREGKLRRLFEAELPGTMENALEGENVLLVLLNQICRDEHGEPLLSSDPHFSYRSRNRACVFSETGKLLKTLELKTENIAPLCGFLDQNRLFLGGVCYDLRTHRQEWSLAEGLAVDSRLPPSHLSGGRLAMLYDTGEGRRYLTSFLPDGSERVTRELPGENCQGVLLPYGDGLLVNCGRELICCDAFLSEHWHAELRKEGDDFCEAKLDETSELLYLCAYDLVISFDLSGRQIRASRKLSAGEDCYLHGVLPGAGAVMLTGDSTLQVWDADLNPISRHRVKGTVTQLLHRDGKTYLVTNADVQSDFRQVGGDWDVVQVRDGCVRLYELRKREERAASTGRKE